MMIIIIYLTFNLNKSSCIVCKWAPLLHLDLLKNQIWTSHNCSCKLQKMNCISHKSFQLSPSLFFLKSRLTCFVFLPGSWGIPVWRHSTELRKQRKSLPVWDPWSPWVREEPRSYSSGTMWARLGVAVGGSMPRASRSGWLHASGAGCAGKRQQRQASSAEVRGVFAPGSAHFLQHFWSLWRQLKSPLKVE